MQLTIAQTESRGKGSFRAFYPATAHYAVMLKDHRQLTGGHAIDRLFKLDVERIIFPERYHGRLGRRVIADLNRQGMGHATLNIQ